MNLLKKINGQRAAIDYPIGASDTIMFMFVEVTPEIANEWLKANRKNRKVKENTVTAYHRDMRNDAWMITHQGIAFDDAGNLIDGQHRLMAVLAAKRPVTMLVSAGWPTGAKRKTMDAVDRGVQRSLKDQLELQHGIKDAGSVVKIVNQIVAAALGLRRVFKSTTDSTLAVFELYQEEIKWLLANPVKTLGIRKAGVVGCMALGRAVWPDKTAEFYSRLITGENLSGKSPILLLRNYLIGDKSARNRDDVPSVIAQHLVAFIEGRELGSVTTHGTAGMQKMLGLQSGRIEKIQKIYAAPELQNPKAVQATAKPAQPAAPKSPAPRQSSSDAESVHPTSSEGVRIGNTLSRRFTTTDLSARLDRGHPTGYWLSHWRNKKWIEPVGANEFEKTETFGK